LVQDSLEEINANGEATVLIGGRSFQVKKQFLDDLSETKLEDRIAQLKRALIVFHSPIDNTVSIDNAQKIFLAAKHPKSFVSLDHADHLLSREEDSSYVGHMISAWAGSYMDLNPKPKWQDDIRDNRVVARTGQGYKTEIMANGFGIIADEPVAIGGTNTGPTPYDLLASALGTCTSMTLRMYADRKGLNVESISTEVKHSKVHAQDCEDCEQKNNKVDQFQRSITIKGDLTKAQRERMLQIADRCPVHRTLESSSVIVSQLL